MIGLYDEEEDREITNYLKTEYKLELAEEEDLKRGMEKGIEKGKKQSKIEIAKKLKENNVDIEIIVKSTGLTKEKIKNL